MFSCPVPFTLLEKRRDRCCYSALGKEGHTDANINTNATTCTNENNEHIRDHNISGRGRSSSSSKHREQEHTAAITPPPPPPPITTTAQTANRRVHSEGEKTQYKVISRTRSSATHTTHGVRTGATSAHYHAVDGSTAGGIKRTKRTATKTRTADDGSGGGTSSRASAETEQRNTADSGIGPHPCCCGDGVIDDASHLTARDNEMGKRGNNPSHCECRDCERLLRANIELQRILG